MDLYIRIFDNQVVFVGAPLYPGFHARLERLISAPLSSRTNVRDYMTKLYLVGICHILGTVACK